MNEPIKHHPDPSLDLLLERTVDVPKELVWKAWTCPEQLKQWFSPAPWTTIECEIDLRPGGLFRTVMRSPEGQEFPGDGCYLEVVENEKLVWTSAMAAGYRPRITPTDPSTNTFCFTAVITLEATEKGTNYSALVIHPDEESKQLHEAMGFHFGWGAAFDQLVAMIKSQGESS